MIIEAACGCSIGKVRSNNEDNFYFNGKFLPIDNQGTDKILTTQISTEQPEIFGVFDGMGGEQRGEEASYLAAQAFQKMMSGGKMIDSKSSLTEACLEANKRVCERMDEANIGRMGSTVATILCFGNELWVCNLGDSRIYGLCEGKLTQWSVDHTDKAYLERKGITGRKPSLTQHLGIRPDEMVIEPYIDCKYLRRGEKFLICSDGLTDMVTPEEIEYYLKENVDVAISVERLINLALERGGKDNVTVIVGKCINVPNVLHKIKTMVRSVIEKWNC